MSDFKVDWFKVVTELEYAGMTLQQQAKEVEVKSKTTVFYWKTGSEPAFSKGMKLIDVYKSVIGTTEGICISDCNRAFR